MLAEIFLMHLQTLLRAATWQSPRTSSRFVPITLPQS